MRRRDQHSYHSHSRNHWSRRPFKATTYNHRACYPFDFPFMFSLEMFPWCHGISFGPELDQETWTRRPIILSINPGSYISLGNHIALLSDSNVCFWISLGMLQFSANLLLNTSVPSASLGASRGKSWKLRHIHYERQWSLWSLLWDGTQQPRERKHTHIYVHVFMICVYGI